ncbi:MAG TPA: PAS domain S-box protein [Balneolaceae bacterium]
MENIFKAINPVSKVILSYLLIASLWILFSDQLVDLLAAETGKITVYQTYKGLFFVSATTVFLYILVSRIINELEQSRTRLQKIMDQSPGIICTVKEDGRFAQVSKAAKDVLGYTPEELLNNKFLAFVHPDDVELTTKIAIEVIKGTEFRGFTNRYIRNDGEIVHLEWSARWDDEDELMHAVAIDVTALKEAENETAKERNILRSIIDNIPDYVFAKDQERRMILSNKAMNRAIFGEKYEREGLGKTAFDMFSPEVAKPIDDDDKRVIEAGELIINREEMVYGSKGDKLWLQTTKVPLRNQNNEIYGLVGITRNVTKKKKAEDQIRLAKERYEMVMKATRDTVYDWNIAKSKLSWGNNFESNHAQNYSIKYWLERIHPEDQKRVEKSLNQTLESPSKTKWESEYRYVNENRSFDTLLERGFIIRDKKGTAIRMIGSLQDITVLKQKEQEVLESLREKEVLLSEVHHRVKNNLALVSGIVQLQAFEEGDKELEEKLMSFVMRIHSIANIHEQLYQSKSFSKLDFSKNLETLIKNVVNVVQYDVTVALHFKLDSVQLNVNQALPASLIVNEVVTNILRHAFKGLDEGKITAELSCIDDTVGVKIIDNGKKLAEDLNTKESKTVGFELIEVLTKQLNANYKYETIGSESMFMLEFKKTDLKGICNAYL